MKLFSRSEHIVFQPCRMEGRDIVLQTDGRAVRGEGLKFFLNPLANLESIISDTGALFPSASPVGGSIYFAPSLRGPYREQALAELHAYLQVLVLNPSARSLSGRLRLSEGLNLITYYGGVVNDPQGNTFSCSCMTPDASIVAEIGIDRYIKKPYAYAQFAVLFGFLCGG